MPSSWSPLLVTCNSPSSAKALCVKAADFLTASQEPSYGLEMSTRVEGRGVLVTGASSGIGRELAHELGRRGARLAIAARRKELLERVAHDVAAAGGVRPSVHVVDLSERGAAASLAAEAQQALGAIDILVNNAGGGVGGSQWHVGDREEARESFELNLWSPLALTSALVPGMLERARGAVVNVTALAQV